MNWADMGVDIILKVADILTVKGGTGSIIECTLHFFSTLLRFPHHDHPQIILPPLQQKLLSDCTSQLHASSCEHRANMTNRSCKYS
jgi:hypothetical protein